MELDLHTAVVFPGQGTVGGEISGEVASLVAERVGSGDVPYQLSVFASSMDLFRRLVSGGARVDVVAGHSLGEYSAAVACGSISLEDGVRLVAERDRLMNEAAAENPGIMVAVIGADSEAVYEAIGNSEGGIVVAANFNTPRQTVISGEEEAVERVSAALKGRKVRLEVAGAFHSPLMSGASEGMDELLEAVEMQEPEIPMIGASDGDLLENSADIRGALRRQMLAPVMWVAVMDRLASFGVTEIVEAGEGGTLLRMLRDYRDMDFEGKKIEEVAG